jgi:Ca-activated chloride channel family protein
LRQRWLERLLVGLLCARLVAGCSAASQPAPAPSTAGPTAANASAPLDLCRLPDLAPAGIASAPGYTQVQVSVTDPGGSPIAGLKQADFTVQSGSVGSPIKYFREESSLTTPVSLVIVGDVSKSMFKKTVVESADEREKARTALTQAAGGLNDCDEVALVLIGGTYAGEVGPPLGPVTLAQPFTTNHSIALEKMYSVIPSGENRLSDGLRLGLETLTAAHYPNRAMLLMTDGLDQAAIDASAPLLAQVRESGVSFVVIGIGDPAAQEGIVSKLRGSTRVDVAAVRKLALDGGGYALFAKPVDSDEGASLSVAVATINNRLGDGYAIGVDTSPGKAPLAVTLARSSGALVRVDMVPSEMLAEAAARPARPAREIGTARNDAAPEQTRNLPGYTEVAATVMKPDGAFVDGLSKSDFALSVNGVSQPIDFFDAGQVSPSTVGILVDTSGSMTPKLPQARAAIEQFVSSLDPQDQVFLFAFSGKPYLLQPLTNEHNALIQKLALLHAYGQTALFDAVRQSISVAQQSRDQRKVLLVITDGMDNTSSSSADDVVQAAKSSGVIVYSIGIGETNAPAGQNVAVGPFVLGGLGDMDRVDAVTLSRLANTNGGKSYILKSVGDGAALKKACEEIADALDERHSYAIGFVAHAPANYAPTTMPIDLQVPAHNDYSVQAPKVIPVPSTR